MYIALVIYRTETPLSGLLWRWAKQLKRKQLSSAVGSEMAILFSFLKCSGMCLSDKHSNYFTESGREKAF